MKTWKWLQNQEQSKHKIGITMCYVVAWGEVEACLFYAAFEAHMTENMKVVFSKENTCNSLWIDLSPATPWCFLE